MAALSLIHGGDIYSPHPVPEGERLLDFSANLNPLGMPEEVRQALCSHVEEYAAYPDPLCRSLRQALAEHHRLCPEWFLCGNGAADLIFRLAFGTRPKRALIPAPTFAEYAQALTEAGCETTRYVLSEQQDFLLDERFLKTVQPGVDLVFVCNPNNPTGLITQRSLLERLLERCEQVGARLCVDECFLDFLPEEPLLTVLPLLEKHPNLLVLRAFTKLYAMAGIRLGYGVCSDPQLLSAMAGTRTALVGFHSGFGMRNRSPRMPGTCAAHLKGSAGKPGLSERTAGASGPSGAAWAGKLPMLLHH